MINTSEQDTFVQLVRPRKRALSKWPPLELSATVFLQFRTHI